MTAQTKHSAQELVGAWLASARDGHLSELAPAFCSLRTPSSSSPASLSLPCSYIDGALEIVLGHKRPSSGKKTKLTTGAI